MSEKNKTKFKILQLLKLNGQITQHEISESLGLTKMAVSRQLNTLCNEDSVSYTEVRQKIGRPVLMYSLTEKANKYFPNEHPNLSVSLIEAIKNCAGETTLNSVLEYRLNSQIEEYEDIIHKSDTVEEKIDKLVNLRTAEGYMAHFEKISEKEYLFTENNCPISTAAKNCMGICENELVLLKRILGENVNISRTEHLMSDEFRCSYKILVK